MSILKNIMTGKNYTSYDIARELAKDYRKKANEAKKRFLKKHPNYKEYSSYAVKIIEISFKNRKVKIGEEDGDIRFFKCKSEDQLFEQKKFTRLSLKPEEGYYFIGKTYEEIEIFLDELKKLNYHPQWELDPKHYDYHLFPVLFEV